ncbi:SHSP domain-containing protein [Aphelenchoides bicaudatus]|nr:SHSP domain-containing protein [Aphelenchoides bicaudatus]
MYIITNLDAGMIGPKLGQHQGDVVSRFDRGNRWWNDWPSDWPSMGTMLPRFSSHLDRFDRNWRDDPFWRDLYPRWAEPIFKDGLDVRTNIYNDRDRFAVEVDTYQFRPEELEVKTMDDTLLIEGRHEDVRDSDNYTKMYFVRKYQLPPDVHPQEVTSSIDSGGRLIVEARKPYAALDGRERVIPIMGSSKGFGSRSNSYSPRDVGRSSFRNGNNYNGNYNGYRSESRGADYRLGDSLRNNGHESRFRNEFSSSNNLTTNVPVTATRESYSRSASRSSRREFQDGPNGYYSEFRSSSRGPGDFPRSSSRGPGDFHRSSSRGPDYYRSSGEHLLRPEPELGERSASRASARSVRIQREERYN